MPRFAIPMLAPERVHDLSFHREYHFSSRVDALVVLSVLTVTLPTEQDVPANPPHRDTGGPRLPLPFDPTFGFPERFSFPLESASL
ncbi:MAG: hypothetical protein IT425_11710 [Pirellulales bacterium]|nr:hypothetical protein [Pirellulales bacterium]